MLTFSRAFPFRDIYICADHFRVEYYTYELYIWTPLRWYLKLLLQSLSFLLNLFSVNYLWQQSLNCILARYALIILCIIANSEEDGKNKTFKLRHFRESGRVLNWQLSEEQQKQTQRRGGSGDGECHRSVNIRHQLENTAWIVDMLSGWRSRQWLAASSRWNLCTFLRWR